ncbi:MAG: hypothetical protein Q8O93_02595 [bacterium]|nr:hypothetical protein [bacterium]
MNGIFTGGLKKLGHNIEIIDNFIVFDYVITGGRFKDTQIKLGFEMVQFPMQIPHGPHFTPLFVPINEGASSHPEKVLKSNLFKDNGGHLSRPYPETLKKTVEAYMAYIAHLFNTL